MSATERTALSEHQAPDADIDAVVVARGAGVTVPGPGRRPPAVLLDGVDLTVAPGEWLTIVGPNGAGKSTLLRAVAGLRPYAGSITACGHEVRTTSPRVLATRIAMVAQQPIIPVATTVADYVLLGRTAHLGWLQREGRRDQLLVAEVLAQLSLDRFADRHLETLSGGELQRVLLARALVQQPAVLLLDEPTSALDVGHQLEVLELVDELRTDHGLTVLSTMHDLTLAGEFTDRLLLLDDGRPVRDGTPVEVLEADLLRRTYGAEVTVLPPDPAAGRRGPVVVPVRRGAHR